MLYHPINKLLNTVEYLKIVLSLSSSGYIKLIQCILQIHYLNHYKKSQMMMMMLIHFSNINY